MCLLLVVLRSLLAMSRMDEVELEVYSGSLASAILEGMPLDPTALPIIVHLRGSYIVGLLLVPLFAVFGAKLWVLKVLAVAWSLATLVLWILALDRVLGLRAAVAGGLVYCLLPPSFQMVDVTILGSHGETILFIAAALLFLVCQTRSLLASPARAFVFGALLGLGFLFSMQFLGVIPALLVAWWAHEAKLAQAEGAPRSRALKDSLLIGLPLLALSVVLLKELGTQLDVPMWWQLALTGVLFAGLSFAHRRLRALMILGGLFVASAPMAFITRSTVVVNQRLEDRIVTDLGAFCAKYFDAIFALFDDSWLFVEVAGPTAGGIAKALFGLAAIVGLIATLRRAFAREPLALFLVLQPCFFFCLYAATNLELKVDAPLDGMGSRYVMPVLACVSGWIAIAVHDLWKAGKRPLAHAALAAPCVAGLIGLAPLMEPSIAWQQPSPRGDRLHYFNAHFEHAGGAKLTDRLRWVVQVDGQWAAFRPGYYREAFRSERFEPKSKEAFVGHLRDALLLGGELGAHRLFDLGAWAFENRVMHDAPLARMVVDGLDVGSLHRAMPKDAEGRYLPEPNAVWFVRGYGAAGLEKRFLESYVTGALFEPARFLAQLPKAWRGYALQGAGFVCGDRLSAFNVLPLTYMWGCEAGLEAEELDNFFMGLGIGFRTHYVEDEWFLPEPGALRIERMLGERAAGAFYRGLMSPTERFVAPR